MNFIIRLLFSQAIGITNGKAKTVKGKHSSRLVAEITATCDLNRIQSGEIWIAKNGTIRFSNEIPKEKHQTFRNVIQNINI